MELVPLKLEGTAVRLDPLTEGHLEALCAIGLEPLLWRATTIRVTTREEMGAYVMAALEAQRRGTALPFMIVEKKTGAVVGSTRFHSYSPDDRRVEIGFTWIGLPWQRTVVNTAAKYLLLRHAFESLGCVRVEFRADSENEASCRAIRRIGARPEAVLRSYRVSGHRGVRDIAVFGIVAEEWPAVKMNLEKKLMTV